MRKLEERVAIVTGGGRGIGRAIASKLAAEGARVVLNDLDEEPARAAVEQLRAQGAEAAAVVGDVAAADFGERIVAEALSRFGGLDVVVNNAGYIWNTTVQKTTDEQWHHRTRRAPPAASPFVAMWRITTRRALISRSERTHPNHAPFRLPTLVRLSPFQRSAGCTIATSGGWQRKNLQMGFSGGTRIARSRF